jgi:hypothetical protein
VSDFFSWLTNPDGGLAALVAFVMLVVGLRWFIGPLRREDRHGATTIHPPQLSSDWDIDFDSLRLTAAVYSASEDRAKRGLARALLRILDAVKYAHEQRGDDRCWMDITKVYEAAGLPPPDTRVGDQAAMLENCRRFVTLRCNGGGPWRTYAELEKSLGPRRVSGAHCRGADGIVLRRHRR